MRLSQENEDCQRASNHQPPPPNRPQEALRLKKRFPKAVRLRTRAEFRRVQRGGKRLQGSFLFFQLATENFSYPRLGITVSKHYGNAVSRNLFKRRIREIFRELKGRFPAGLQIHVSPRQGLVKPPTLSQVETDFNFLIENLNRSN